MITRDYIVQLHEDLQRSWQVVKEAHYVGQGIDFVCHHNSYIAWKYLKGIGHDRLLWRNGIYITANPATPVRHSWITLESSGSVLAVLELDPFQLRDRGGYSDDLMPDTRIGPLGIKAYGVAVIVDPALVEQPHAQISNHWIVLSAEVMARFQQDASRVPTDIDIDKLESLLLKAQAAYERNQVEW